MRLIVLPLLLPLLLSAGCKDAGSGDDNAVPAPAPTVAQQPDGLAIAPENDKVTSSSITAPPRQPEVRIAGDTAGAATPSTKPQDLLPLARILGIAQSQVPGEIIDVDLDDDDGLMIYEVEVLTAAGRKIEIKIDARRGTVLELEED